MSYVIKETVSDALWYMRMSWQIVLKLRLGWDRAEYSPFSYFWLLTVQWMLPQRAKENVSNENFQITLLTRTWITLLCYVIVTNKCNQSITQCVHSLGHLVWRFTLVNLWDIKVVATAVRHVLGKQNKVGRPKPLYMESLKPYY